MAGNPMATAAMLTTVAIAARKKTDKRKALAVGLASSTLANPLAAIGLTLAMNRSSHGKPRGRTSIATSAKKAVASARSAEAAAKDGEKALAAARRAATAAAAAAENAETAAQKALTDVEQAAAS